MSAPPGSKSNDDTPPVSLRREHPGDDRFLFEVYASTRAEEMALTNWDDSTRQAFLTQQFKAMRQGYLSMFPECEFSIIELTGKTIGRMVLDHSATEIRVVDLALLPEQRCRGIGTFLMRQIIARAIASKKPVRLCVLQNNRARHWYERLQFRKIGESGFYDEMAWRPEELSGPVNSISPDD